MNREERRRYNKENKRKNGKNNNSTKKNISKNEIVEKDGVSLNKQTINRIEKNMSKISYQSYILNKTAMMIDQILATPRNLLQIDSPLLAEALEDEKCQKEFKKSQEDIKNNFKKEDLSPSMYNVIMELECTEDCVIGVIGMAMQQREDLMEALKEEDVFKIAKSIWLLRSATTSIIYFIAASQAFFESTGLTDMYKILSLVAEIYGNQAMALENLMYDEN